MPTVPRLLSLLALNLIAQSVLCGNLYAQEMPSQTETQKYIAGVSFALDYVDGGISLSGGSPVVQPYLELVRNGFYVGASLSYVQIESNRAELDIYFGHRHKFANNLFFDVSYRRYILNRTGDCCGQTRARVILPIGESLGAEFRLGFNDRYDQFNRRARILWDVNDKLLVTGSYGKTSGFDDRYWNIGGVWKLRDRVSLKLHYEGSEGEDPGVVLKLSWSTIRNNVVSLLVDPFR